MRHRSNSRRALGAAGWLALIVWLGGCGQSGRLYLPEQPESPAQAETQDEEQAVKSTTE